MSIRQIGKLDWQIAIHSSGGVKEWNPTHENDVVYSIGTLLPNDTNPDSLIFAIVAEPWLSTLPSRISRASAERAVNTIVDTLNLECVSLPESLAESFHAAEQHIPNNWESWQISPPVVCAMIAIVNSRLYLASCGDCRIFLIRDRLIHKLNRVDTLPETLIDNRSVSEYEWAEFVHPYDPAGALRALRGSKDPDNYYLSVRFNTEQGTEPATIHPYLQLQPDDRIILCSSDVFGDFMSPTDRMILVKHFGQRYTELQNVVEDYINEIRPERIWGDLTILALQVPE